MQTIILLTGLLNFSNLLLQVFPQDPGYSINNYKHPNKAKAVVKRDTNRDIRFFFDETSRDYKKPMAKNKENVWRIFRRMDGKDHLKVKNYKMPNN
jgi:hypothetical protein